MSRRRSAESRVRFLLQGTVRKSGTKLRISPWLTETATGKHLWGKTCDYDLTKVSLFEIEDRITGEKDA